jgi:hypothetical protein
MDSVAQIQVLHDRGRISRVVVEIVAIRPLARAAVASTIDPYDAIAMLQKEQHCVSQSSELSGQP